MSHWEVWTPQYMTYVGSWSLGPPEYGCDWVVVEAETKREAMVKAVRIWRAERTDWMLDCASDQASPFTGLHAEVIFEGPTLEECEDPATPEPVEGEPT